MFTETQGLGIKELKISIYRNFFLNRYFFFEVQYMYLNLKEIHSKALFAGNLIFIDFLINPSVKYSVSFEKCLLKSSCRYILLLG